MNLFELFAKLSLDSSDYEKGISDAEKSAKELSDKWGKGTTQMKSGLKDVGVGVGVLGGLGGVAFKAADGVASTADEIDKMSQKLGLSREAYQEWDYVMNLAGADINSTTAGMKTLVNKFEDAKSGTQSSIEAFEKLGLSMSDMQNMSQEDLFKTVIYKLQDMGDSTERTALATDLLGRSATELRPLLNQTSEATEEQIQHLHDLGGVMSDDAVKDGAAFKDSLTSLKASFQGATASLLKELVPAITKLMDKISKFVADGGLEKIMKVMKELTPVVVALVGAFATFKVISGVAKIVSGLTIAFSVLSGTIPLVVGALGPLLPVIAAITAAVVGIIAVIKNWDAIVEVAKGVAEEFVNFWGEAWEGAKQLASDVWNGITEGISEAWNGLQEFLVGVITEFVEFWSEAWEGAKQLVSDVWNGISEFFSEIWTSISETASEIWNGVTGFFSETWSSIKETATGVWNEFSSWIGETWNGIKEKASETWTNIKEGIGEKWNSIKENTSTAWSNIKSGLSSAWSGITNGVRSFGSSFKSFWGDILSGISGKTSELITSALTWGKDLIDNFIGGIKSMMGKLGDAVKGIASKVKSFLGFSEPEEGPLSNFHTYAPDMIDLFTKGIYDNMRQVETASSDLAEAIRPDLTGGLGTLAVGGAVAAAGAGGDLIIPVYIGANKLDEILIKQEQLINYRSGGR